MKYATAQVNRLGNRDNNEDRFDIIEHNDSVLMVLADGMGGHSGGELAAQVLVSTIKKRFTAAPKPINDPATFLAQAIVAAHQAIISMGKRQNPPLSPRTTCVVCLIQKGVASWAHVGDSRLYLIRNRQVVFRTRDNSYVERLYRQGKISEEEMLTHPKRHHLTECVGGDPTPPMITRGKDTALKYGDIILLCSDGLWGGLSDDRICKALSLSALEEAIDDLAQTAEHETYPVSDNISAVTLRWLQQEAMRTPDLADAAATTSPPTSDDVADELTSAIDEIERTIKQFEHEMKK